MTLRNLRKNKFFWSNSICSPLKWIEISKWKKTLENIGKIFFPEIKEFLEKKAPVKILSIDKFCHVIVDEGRENI